MSINKYYIDCTKVIVTQSVNESLTPVESNNFVSIKGYLGSGSNNIVRIADKETYETLRKFFTSDLSISSDDKIIYNNKTYEVVGDPQNTVNKNHHIKCLVRKIDDIKQE